MNHIIKIVSFFMIGVILCIAPTSCEEDPLKQNPVSSFTEKAVFGDITLTENYLENIYAELGTISQLREMSLAAETDQTAPTRYVDGYVWANGQITPSNLGYYYSGFRGEFLMLSWEHMYNNIKNINVLLANIEDVPTETSTEEELKKQIKAEAYFLRAYCYTQLLRGHGGVILIDEPPELGGDYSGIERSSLADTRDFILSDIEKAINGLPKKGNIQQGDATQGAAAALKVRLLTFCASDLVNGGYEPGNPLVSFQEGSQSERWKAVRDAAKNFIDGNYGDYNLTGTTQDPPENMTQEQIWEYANNFHSIFLQKSAWNDEVIWGIQFTQESPWPNYASINLRAGPNGYYLYGTRNPQERFVRKFEMADGTEFDWDGPPSVNNETVREATASELENNPLLNPYNGREPRFYASIMYHGAPWPQKRPEDINAPDTIQSGYFVKEGGDYTNDEDLSPGVDTRQGPVYEWNGTKTGYYIRKLLDPEIDGRYENNVQTWIEMRYAEILLDYAEACIELDEIQKGLEALNRVRNRAGLPDRVISNQNEAREFVRHERNVEFFAEGHRWYDIRRWMIADEVLQDVHKMNVYEWENGKMRFEWKKDIIVMERNWNEQWWLPLQHEELNRAPQLEQNPGGWQ